MEQKNVLGELGERCNNCSGLGYTTGLLRGQKINCLRCGTTGIEPNGNFVFTNPVVEMQELKKDEELLDVLYRIQESLAKICDKLQIE